MGAFLYGQVSFRDFAHAPGRGFRVTDRLGVFDAHGRVGGWDLQWVALNTRVDICRVAGRHMNFPDSPAIDFARTVPFASITCIVRFNFQPLARSEIIIFAVVRYSSTLATECLWREVKNASILTLLLAPYTTRTTSL